MGLANYFKAGRTAPSLPQAPAFPPPDSLPLPAFPRERHGSPYGSSNAQSGASSQLSLDARSIRSTRSSFLDDIKHEVMVNYLHQQQCSHLWISHLWSGRNSAECEGVMLRKSRGNYLACPPELTSSTFAIACAALNVQVCKHYRLNVPLLTNCRLP